MIPFRRLQPVVAVTLLGAAILGAPSRAQAAFTLYVQEYNSSGTAVGGPTIVAGSEPGSGVGTILGASGSTSNFTFSFNASQNSAVSGAPPSLHLDSFTIGASSNTSDYLVIGLSEGGPGHGWAGPSSAPLISNLSSIAGIGSASVTLQSFADANDNLFGVPAGTTVPPPGNPFAPPLTTSAGAVAAPTITMNASNSGSGITTFANFNSSGRYSLTQVATVTGLGDGQTISFNATTTVAPAPAGLVMLLSGLPVLGAYSLRRLRRVPA